MKNKSVIWIIVFILVVGTIGAAVYFGKASIQKGTLISLRKASAPSPYVTRGEMAKLLIEELMRPVPGYHPSITLVTDPAPHFKDVPKTHPYFIYIETAYENDFMVGTGENTFRPEDIMTRAQFAVLTVRAFALNDSTYTKGTPYSSDVPADTWFTSAVETLYAVQAIPVQYRPHDPLERTFAKEVLQRMPRV